MKARHTLGRWRRFVAASLVGAAALAAIACDSSSASDLEVSLTAEVVDPGVPVTASVTGPEEGDEGRIRFGVVIDWDGDEPIVLSDSRFTGHLESPDGGDLVMAGRGCGAQWNDDGGLMQACTADLQIISLDPGGSHEYPVVVWPEVGPLRLEPGTYEADETVQWWGGDALDEQGFPRGEASGSFVVHLTFTVE